MELCSCHGEPVDELRSADPELLAYLRRRPDSTSDERPDGRVPGMRAHLQGRPACAEDFQGLGDFLASDS